VHFKVFINILIKSTTSPTKILFIIVRSMITIVCKINENRNKRHVEHKCLMNDVEHKALCNDLPKLEHIIKTLHIHHNKKLTQ
jgi:hypothetical protein